MKIAYDAVVEVLESVTALDVQELFRGAVWPGRKERGVFFFVDDNPRANWAHECIFVFVPEGSNEAWVSRGEMPPREAMRGRKTTHEFFHRALDGKMIRGGGRDG